MWKQRAPPNFEGGNAHPSHGYLPRVWWNKKKHNWFPKLRYSVLASSLQLPCIYLYLLSIASSLGLLNLHCIVSLLHHLFIASSLHCIFSSLHLLFISPSLSCTLYSLHLSLLHLLLIVSSLHCLHLLSTAPSLHCIFFLLHLLFIASSFYCIFIRINPNCIVSSLHFLFMYCIFLFIDLLFIASLLHIIITIFGKHIFKL